MHLRGWIASMESSGGRGASPVTWVALAALVLVLVAPAAQANFVAGGTLQLRVSPTGSTWTAPLSVFTPISAFYDLTYGDGRWIAAGGAGTVYTSTDGW